MDVREKFEMALEKVQKAPRYTGGEMNSSVKDWDEAPLHFGFCFPDTYEVGMSHLGLKILYGLINREKWSICERFFMPWTDMIAIMKEEGIPLLSMESRRPLKDFDVIGFTLQYEMSYSNILAMMDMGGVPLEGSERGEGDPIVVAGGPCAFNPEPLAPFIDAFMIGDGEDVMTELNRVILRRKEEEAAYFKEVFGKADIHTIVCAMARLHSSTIKTLDIVIPRRVISIMQQNSEDDDSLDELCQAYLQEYLESSKALDVVKMWI